MSRKLREPRWLTTVELRILHAEVMRLFGGRDGLRDAGLLESAADAPRNRYLYEKDRSVFDLAATLAASLCRNHPFVDGNKRVSLQSIRMFLFLNGYSFTPDMIETVTVIEGLAAGDVDVETLGKWIQRSSQKRS